jgi:tryptophan synthase beta chain
MKDKLAGKQHSDFIGCESKAVPHTTRGVYTYDYADTGEAAPLVKMLTLGHDYRCPPIHAGGLRYHGMSPSISYLIQKGYMRSVAYGQKEVFEAAKILAQSEGWIIAPETAHSLRFVIDEALRCKKSGKRRIIAMNYSGHGLLDLSSYDQFLTNKLSDYEPEQIHVQTIDKK